MDRFRSWPIVLVLGLLVLLGAPAGLTAAQAQGGLQENGPGPDGQGINPQQPELYGEGLRIENLGEIGNDQSAYLIEFDVGAYVPEMPYEEAMVVKVISGTFAFLNRDGGIVIIDPQGIDSAGQPIQGREVKFLDVVPQNPGDGINPEPPAPAPPDYVLAGEVILDPDGNPCYTLCRVPTGGLVQIEPGFTVYLPEQDGGTTCFFCNISGDAGAVLRVVAPNGFSWTDFGGLSLQSGLRAGTSPNVRAWALNPGARCQ